MSLIEQNLKAQANILKALTNAYAAYAPIRKSIAETAHKRNVQITALIESFDVSDDVLKKTVKGLDFYRKMDVNVRKLLSRVRGTCKVQEEERLQMFSKSAKKFPSQSQPVDRSLGVTTPKLRDYMEHKQLSNVTNETSLPYNPYYNPPHSNYVSSSNRPLTENRQYPTLAKSANVDVNQFYSSVSRPPPVGSETTVIPTTVAEPSGELKSSVSVTMMNLCGYNYPYHSTSLTMYSSQPPACAASNVTYTVAQNLNPLNPPSMYTGSYPVQYSQVSAPVTNYQTYNYSQGVYNPHQSCTIASEVNDYTKGCANYATYADAQISTVTNTTLASNPITNSTTVAAFPSPAHISTTSACTYPQASLASNTPSTYQNAATVYSAPGFGVAGGAVAQNIHPSVNLPTRYINSYGSATTGANTTSYAQYSSTNISTAYTSNSCTNVSSIQRPYSAALVQPSVATQYNSQYSVTGYPASNSPKQVYNQGVTNFCHQNYYNQPGYYFDNYGTAYDPAYQYGSVTPQQTQVQASTSRNSDTRTPNIVGVDAVTHNDSRYTTAGHHNTSNIDSSSVSLDGRSFATQYAAVGETTSPISLNAQYYVSQYGHQYSNLKSDDGVEIPPPQSQTKCNESENRTQAKRNSMTYMQADSNGKTTSTYTNNSSNASSSAGADKKESNLDLLTDIDFDVSDAPLLPLSEAAAANKIIEKLTTLNLNSSSVKKVNSKYVKISLSIPSTSSRLVFV